MNGVLKTIRRDRGFGFILADDGREYFFHSSGTATVFEDLAEGDRVTFEVEASQKGPRANRVERVLQGAAKENANG